MTQRFAPFVLVLTLLPGWTGELSAAPGKDPDVEPGPATELDSYCVLPTRQRVAPPSIPFTELTPFAEVEPNNTQATANFLALGFDPGEDSAFDVTGSLTAGDLDFFTFDLLPGDVLGANRVGAGSLLQLLNPGGVLQVGSQTDAAFIYPNASPLPGGGGRALAWVVDTAGTYAFRISGGSGAYTLELRLFRPGLESTVLGTHQTVFIDFDGATINALALFGQGSTNAVLSPLTSFLAGWGLTPADENAVIDAVLAAVAESLDADVATLGNNGDFQISGVHGEFDVEILNSRDHADPFGQPNVSRVIVGGTIAQLGISTIGIAESIDPGNYEASETAVVLLDLLSAAAPNPNSLNTFPRAPGVTILDVVGVGVGNITAHEAGHYLGNFHTTRFNALPNIMDQGGNLGNIVGVGPDGIFGSADDIDVDLGDDTFANEGFTGTEDTLNVVAFDGSTGTISQCGNNVIDPFEVCDGTALGGQSCTGLGFDGGTLACAADCSGYDTSGCFFCRTGFSTGDWNLPTATSTGTIAGTVYDLAGVALYKLHGQVFANGTVSGTLSDGLAPDPDYVFSGTWVYTNPTLATGTWGAYLYTPTGASPIGKIGGRWSDNPSFPVIGAYRAEWRLCP